MPPAWPAASYDDWTATCDTLHAHTQVLGKLAAELAPLLLRAFALACFVRVAARPGGVLVRPRLPAIAVRP